MVEDPRQSAVRLAAMSIGPLVDVIWLSEHLEHAPLRVVDCRWYLADPEGGRKAYAAGHIPGAIFASLDDDMSAQEGAGRHPLPTRGEFAATIGGLGISNRSVVVAYDDGGGSIAGRFWWMMRWVGHNNVAVLDGGIRAWEAAERPISALLPTHEPTSYELGEDTMPTIEREALRTRLGAVNLMDARAPARYRGEVEPIDPVPGHIPSALNAPHGDNLDTDGTLLDAEALRDKYTGLGATEGAETIVYCGSGVTACLNILAMEVAGLPTATLYPGSWSDWSGDPETPKVSGR